jgi:hypothetical protein
MYNARVRAFAIALLVVVATPSPARADPREDARREFAAGQDADKRKDWPAAIVHYARANELVPHPFAVYNIANDYEQLGQLREAVRWYERYLATATDAHERAKVQRVVVELRARPSKLVVHSLPNGARVTIDGTFAGTTPYVGVARGGTHRVGVDLGGQHDERDVALELGEPHEEAFTLGGGATGTLVVTGPPGALVTVDGESAGIAPAQLDVSAGQHAVHVQAPGYQPFDATPFVPAGRVSRVDAPAVRGDGAAEPGGTRTINANYFVALSAGVEAKNTDGVALIGFGVRISRIDILAHIGRSGGQLAIDAIFRWQLLGSRLSPFLALGYVDLLATGQSASGFQATVGLRYDLTHGDRFGAALLVESGVRFFASTTDMTGMTVPSQLQVPILASLEFAYGGVSK